MALIQLAVSILTPLDPFQQTCSPVNQPPTCIAVSNYFQVQDFAFVLAELHRLLVGQFLSIVQTALDGSFASEIINSSSQLGIN